MKRTVNERIQLEDNQGDAKEKKITPPLKLKRFTKVTARSTYLFDQFKAQDQTNLTHSSRTPDDYKELLQLRTNLSISVKQRAKALGRKITILDAGCGQAKVLAALLDNKKLTDSLGQAIGISKDYFSSVKAVAEKHSDRFTYYSGYVQDILRKDLLKADLILDTWGAYAYSKDKLEVLRLYYDSLAPEGQAVIYGARQGSIRTQGKHNRVSLFKFLAKEYPEHFKVRGEENYYPTLVMKKVTQRFPVPSHYTVRACRDENTLGVSRTEYTKAQLQRGNAIAPDDVRIVMSNDQPMQLRPRRYSNP